jgi:hypothetical protein
VEPPKVFREDHVIWFRVSVTYNAISLERGSWIFSSGFRGVSEGRDGVKGVIALGGST